MIDSIYLFNHVHKRSGIKPKKITDKYTTGWN